MMDNAATAQTEVLHDLVWGAEDFAKELFGRADTAAKRKAYHMLEKGYLPGKKVGGTWCGSRQALRRFLAGEVAA